MKIVVIGAGGHARSVCDILLSLGEHEIIGLIDPSAQVGFFDIPVLGDDNLLVSIINENRAEGAFVALGSNKVRKKMMQKVVDLGYKVVSVISPYSVVSRFASIGNGTVVMPGAIINANSTIGQGCIINTNSSIDHDDMVCDYCHIAPGATICGAVSIGESTFIGAGARIIDKINIGSNVMLGAGAVAISDIPSCCTAVGIPARIIG